MTARAPAVWSVVGRRGDALVAVDLDRELAVQGQRPIDLAAAVTAADDGVRWVWHDTAARYPALLAAGVRVARCHDLRLAHAILRGSAHVDPAAEVRRPSPWDAAPEPEDTSDTLFPAPSSGPHLPDDVDAAVAELRVQLAAIAGSAEPGRLRLLVAAESAGALLAAELHAAGLPLDAATHDALLADVLGPEPSAGVVPARIAETAAVVRAALGDPSASLDAPPRLLRALQRVGVHAESTNRWQLRRFEHPVIAPLLEYKRLMRLWTANGWAWRREWAPDGRFRPVYVPAGVVTGRWASSGGGALQLPRMMRPALRADPGWLLVTADVAQLEPRVLAAMAGDTALASAGRGRDLYAGLVADGTFASRAEAKVALLGAMYGATSGDSGRLVRRLRRAYPRAMALVDDAAATGERGGTVTTWLGRSSPEPGEGWRRIQGRTDAEELRRRVARDRGRFTRNFVVQGTAAEWALAWLADLRARLAAMPEAAVPAPRSGPVFGIRAHVAFFLHDEILVHTPAEHADPAAAAVEASARAAAALLFGDAPVDFPLAIRIAEDAAKD